MPVEASYYLWCTKCGTTFSDKNGNPEYGEDPDEVRDMAKDEGWLCGIGREKTELVIDLCEKCREI